jgi:DNA polymerase III delta subunit
LLKKTDFQEFRELDVAGLARWLVTTAKEHDSTISFDVAQYLVERVGANQQILSNELDKLVLYNQRITKDTINLLTQSTPQSTIFQLLEAAYGGNARKTLQLYQEQRSLKVEPPQIIAMLTWQLHVLALIKTGGERTADVIANEASMSPFVVRKSQAIAQRISVVELKELIRELLTIDARSKRENLDADEALQNYLLRLASS